jgi:hypothetical protein
MLHLKNLKQMASVRIAVMFITYQTARCHNPDDQYVSIISVTDTLIKMAATDNMFLKLFGTADRLRKKC